MVLESLVRRPAVSDIPPCDPELPAAFWHVQWVVCTEENQRLRLWVLGDDC